MFFTYLPCEFFSKIPFEDHALFKLSNSKPPFFNSLSNIGLLIINQQSVDFPQISPPLSSSNLFLFIETTDNKYS